MAGFLRAVTTVFAVGMIGGMGALMLLPPAAEDGPLFARARVPDPPATPCKKQYWPNTDRSCQTWTAPRREVAKLDADRAHNAAAERPPVAERASLPAPPSQPPAATERPLATAVSEAPAPAAHPTAPPALSVRAAQRSKNEAARMAHRASDNPGIPVTAVASDGTRRTILIRPTSQQDVYYYARREFAAINPAVRQ